MDYCDDGDGSRTQCIRSVLASATESKRRNCDQPLRIRNKNKKQSLDGNRERERLGGC